MSRPMQIALAAVLVFAALWFVALKPKDDAAEPVAATPAPVASTPAPVAAGGAGATSGVGKIVESANNAAKTSNDKTAADEKATGDQSAATATKTPAAGAPAATTPVGTSPKVTKTSKATTKAAGKKAGATRSAAQRRADAVTRRVTKDLAARRAVVVLVWSSKGEEDRMLKRRVTKEISRRNGRVRVYLVPVSQVGLYDGLLGTLNLGQTPSTIVIAPNNTAKVLGGLVSTQRIDRLTSAALLIAPVETAKKP